MFRKQICSFFFSLMLVGCVSASDLIFGDLVIVPVGWDNRVVLDEEIETARLFISQAITIDSSGNIFVHQDVEVLKAEYIDDAFELLFQAFKVVVSCSEQTLLKVGIYSSGDMIGSTSLSKTKQFIMLYPTGLTFDLRYVSERAPDRIWGGRIKDRETIYSPISGDINVIEPMSGSNGEIALTSQDVVVLYTSDHSLFLKGIRLFPDLQIPVEQGLPIGYADPADGNYSVFIQYVIGEEEQVDIWRLFPRN